MNIIDTRDLLDKKQELLNEINDFLTEKDIEEIPDFEEEQDLHNHIFSYAENNTEVIPEIYKDEEEINFEDFATELIQEIQHTVDSYVEIAELENYIGAQDFDFGVTLIDEDDFTEYCEDLVKDCGYIDSNLPSWIEIDWESTANNMRMDYSEVEYEEVNYLYRV